MKTNETRFPTLAELASTRPAASRVFHRLGLDYCCGGRRRLDDACAAKGLDPHEILAQIDADRTAAGDPTVWSERSPAELIHHIVEHYHARLREELPELRALAARIEERHADKASCPRGLTAHLGLVHEAVLDHLAKEEQILFPLILAGRGRDAACPVQAMEVEHEDHAVNLGHIRSLTNDLIPPSEACATWKSLYLRLEALEEELMEHIHLENNVLFPAALCD